MEPNSEQGRSLIRPVVFFFGLVVVGLLVAGVLWLLGAMFHDFLGAQNNRSEVVRNYALVCGGIFGLGLAAWRSSTASRQADTAERGQVTTRIIEASKMLNEQTGEKPALTVRLSAIYSLIQIANESPQDAQPICRLLSSYVVANAQELIFPANSDLGVDRGQDFKNGVTQIHRSRVKGRLRADVRAAIESWPILRRAGLKFELTGANFARADLQGYNLAGIDMSGANFDHASLSFAYLDECDLSHSYLPNTNFQGADFGNCSLIGAEIIDADFYSAHMSDVCGWSMLHHPITKEERDLLVQNAASKPSETHA